MTKEIVFLISNNTAELLQILSSLNQEQINIIPFKGSWTAGQLIRHLIKSNSGFVQLINGDVKDTERKPDAMAERIKADFSDFTIKMSSRSFVIPENYYYKIDILLSSLKSINTELIRTVQTLDLTKTCIGFKFPVYGQLTRLEAVHFVIYHTRRHIIQLRNIVHNLNKKVASQI